MISREIDSVSNDRILLDAPTLFQAGADRLCTCTVAVVAERDKCMERITKRDGLTDEQANARLNSQFSADYFEENCTYVICNNGNLTDLQCRADEIIEIINKG